MIISDKASMEELILRVPLQGKRIQRQLPPLPLSLFPWLVVALDTIPIITVHPTMDRTLDITLVLATTQTSPPKLIWDIMDLDQASVIMFTFAQVPSAGHVTTATSPHS